MLQLSLTSNFIHNGQQHVSRDDHAGAQVAELIGEFVLLVQRSARAHHCADLLDSVVGDHVLRTVVHEQGDRLAFFDAKRLQAGRERVAHRVEFRPCNRASVPDLRRAGRHRARMMAQHFVKRLGMRGDFVHRIVSCLSRNACRSIDPGLMHLQ